MASQFMKAMKLYVIAHLGLGLIYFLFHSFLIVNEKTPNEISKIMLITFSIVNIIVYIISNQLNQEKTRTRQMKSEYYLYALVVCEILMAIISFCFIGK